MNFTNLGKVVLLKLSEHQCGQINARMLDGEHCNSYQPGDIVAVIVVRQWSAHCLNGKAILDGNFDLWVTSIMEGDGPGQFQWAPLQTIAGE